MAVRLELGVDEVEERSISQSTGSNVCDGETDKARSCLNDVGIDVTGYQ
jgi:hypothetical protein